MPRSTATVVENNFSKGLITEAGGLNFPENAFTELSNCRLEKTGGVTRRFGMDYEDNRVNHTVSRDTASISNFLWEAVAGEDITFLVTQFESTLRFYRVLEGNSISENKHTFTVNLATFSPVGAPNPRSRECQFSYGDGKLFVTHPFLDPFYVEYTVATDAFTATEITIEIRDFEGLDDGLDVDERPATLSDYHHYNLKNQGWGTQALVDIGSSTYANTITEFENDVGAYPSNADIWWILKRAENSTGITFFSPGDLKDTKFIGNSPAPKGRFILHPFKGSRNTVSGLTGLPDMSSSYHRPQAVAFYAGRAWYAGVSYREYNSKIYYSQIIESNDKIGKCYQNQDPTSEESSDLLATDGGVINIAEIGQVVRLQTVGDQLVVFASNGIWSIAGAEGSGFKSDDYSVRKISSVGALGAGSFVDVDGMPVWWNSDGIFSCTTNEVGTIIAKSLTETTIQSYYDTFSTSSQKYAKGVYNPKTKIITWVHRITASNNFIDRYHQPRALHFDTVLGCFYHWYMFSDINQGHPTIHSVVYANEKNIYLATTLNAGTTYNMFFCEEKNTTYHDWVTHGSNLNYESSGITGYKIAGEANKRFENNYITVYLENTSTNSSLFLSSVWDFSKNYDTFRWSTPQQVYKVKSTTNWGTIFKRLKLRGQGKSLQLRFFSEEGKPFHLVGWSMTISGNQGE